MNELINVEINENQEPIVNARELHEFLEVNSNYTTWFKRMCEYGFTINEDFIPILEESTGGRPSENHAIKLDMAKEIAMIQRNEKGKQARQYFIKIEKDWNSPEKVMARALIVANKTIEQKNKELQEKSKFINQIASSKNSLLVREVAKIISKSKGIVIGEKRLYEKLREWDLVFKNSTEPKQVAIDRDYLETIEGVKENSAGTFTFKTTRVTGKGQEYILKRLLKEQEEQLSMLG
ncbi:TPA: antA/AntB antirepressor family protein [Clostridioides difficile]|uniref:antA/AntB antirepressor family protein n=1 Tax=Clostridioides TaxID=1870884 RepID=UPI00188C1F2D|nr:antA/AntB antirepressor family protein [Clostridioides difficile]UDN56694.1 antA/AntB antirepressor family protein [Clostridioides sp. ES-S-0010-02]UDN63730.1 antA/AntB antirepressor family protein [Clostridioides sp. ES-W-0016-02]MBY2561109.1 antA/AntB antirepressor family protein [Clostridioides difficile]MDI6260423.1 antA/AntB antirepressor family protein [Clostridioides difficile]WID72923.1 antA/AntB antirepressor family protein [Clostridioides difficile]